MRITHVVRQFHPAIGGLENYVSNLAREQARAGHSVRVVTLDRLYAEPDRTLPRHETIGGVEIVRIPWRGSRRYPLAPGMLAAIDGCDIVHVHAVDFFFDFAALTRLLHRRPMVVSTHGGFFHTGFASRLKQVYFRTVTRTTIGAYRAVLASSVHDFGVFAAIRPTGMTLVENGVDTAKFADAGASTLRKRMVFIGRFSSNKRLDRLIDLLAVLRRSDPEWGLDLIGLPWDEDAASLTRLAQARGVAAAVRIETGLDDAGIAARLADSSFIASASAYEGFGISVIEGMSAGLIPVLNDIAAFRKVAEDSGLGVIGDFDDPEAVAAALLAMLPRDAQTHRALRQAAIAFAGRYRWTAVAARIEEIYRDVLGTRRRHLLGLDLAVVSRAEAIAAIDRRVVEGAPTAVAFANAHTANVAHRRPELRRCLRDFLVFNDGIGVDIASRLIYGETFPANLNGTDFVPAYLADTEIRHRIYLLGGRPEVVEAAAAQLAARFPRHRVVGAHHGYFPEDAAPGIVDRIRSARADLLLVALGNPAQELWIHRHLGESGARLAFGVGALFDFLSGRVPRAPGWMRAARLEWVFRLAIEPRRMWQRYLVGNAVFLARVLRQRRRGLDLTAGGGAAAGGEARS